MNMNGLNNGKNDEWKNKKRRSFCIWFVFNILVAGLLCITIELIRYWKALGIGDKTFFYIINKEAYLGYFYALSMSLLAGALSSIFISSAVFNIKFNWKTLTLTIVSILLLCVVSAIYAVSLDKILLENIAEILKSDKIHINGLLLVSIVSSIAVSICTFLATYPKPDDIVIKKS